MLNTRVENLEEGIAYAIEMIDAIKAKHPEVPEEGWRELEAIGNHLRGTLMQPDPVKVISFMNLNQYRMHRRSPEDHAAWTKAAEEVIAGLKAATPPPVPAATPQPGIDYPDW